MEEENELLDDEEFADGDIIEFLRGLMKECSCTVETVSYTHLTLPTNREV